MEGERDQMSEKIERLQQEVRSKVPSGGGDQASVAGEVRREGREKGQYILCTWQGKV